MKTYIVLFLNCLLFIVSCNEKNKEHLTIKDKEHMNIEDIEIFKNTPAWELAKAVESEDVSEIKNLIKKDTTLKNYQEPVFGTTLLMWSIGAERYNSSRQLLECGINPNIISKFGSTALFGAISYSFYDSKANDDPKFVKLLLDFKADPNINYCSPKIEGQTDPTECGTSPLIFSISRGFEKTKYLVVYGALINYKTKLGTTAATQSLLMEDVNAAYYLIVENKAIVTEPFYFYSFTNDTLIEIYKPFYPVDLLLDWVYEIGSDKYSKKMAIVQEFKNQGIDYFKRKNNISNLILRRIKKLHPNDWETFLEKY